jgi:hypothetical protein
MKKLVMAVCMALAAVTAQAEERSSALIKQFKETHVCPATGKMAVKGDAKSYTCTRKIPDPVNPGKFITESWVVDHATPFCAGKYIGISLDVMYNLQYQKYDKENSLKKDVAENLLCDTLRKYVPADKVMK